MSEEHPGERGSASLLSPREDPNTSQRGRGQGQNPLEAGGCARAPPAPWHRVSHCHHRCHGAGQARASRWLPALPAPPGTAWRCLPNTVPVGDGESPRGAGGTRSHARGDTGELPPRDVAPTSPASFTAPHCPPYLQQGHTGTVRGREVNLSPSSPPESQELAHFTPPQPLFRSGTARPFPTPTLQPENIQYN